MDKPEISWDEWTQRLNDCSYNEINYTGLSEERAQVERPRLYDYYLSGYEPEEFLYDHQISYESGDVIIWLDPDEPDNQTRLYKKMNSSTRDINEVLYFRSDISPFLVHLTKKKDSSSAKEILEKIIEQKKLVANNSLVSDARFAADTSMNDQDKRKFFGAVCFTETPLNEIYCLLEIAKRRINLESYGLVFLKDNLRKKGVSPVLYFNNEQDDQYNVFKALCSLIKTHKNEAAKLLPLISVFGEKIHKPELKGHPNTDGKIDFSWEREWRYPSDNGDLNFTKEDIFVGLCPHNEIDDFEDQFENEIIFIDPMRNVKWYANKLVKRRKELDIQYSVV